MGEKELPFFEGVIEKIARLRDRVLPEALLLVAAFAPSFIVRTELLMGGVSNWHTTGAGSGGVSLAGWWFNLVSTPFFRFLLFKVGMEDVSLDFFYVARLKNQSVFACHAY